jgi:zinc protease
MPSSTWRRLVLVFGPILVMNLAPLVNGQSAPADAASPGGSTAPPSGDPGVPELKEIIARNEKAVGGSEAWRKVSSVSMRGIYQTQDSSEFIGVEILEKAPDKSLYKLKFPNDIVVRDVSDGKTAWIEDPRGGYHEYKGAALASRLRRASLADHSKSILLAATGKVLRSEKIGAHSVYVVEYSSAKDVTSRIYFDADSGFAVRTEDVLSTPEGPYTVQLDLEDYRDVDGLRIPFRMRRVEKGAVFNIRLTQVKINPVIDDSIFAKPESASASR